MHFDAIADDRQPAAVDPRYGSTLGRGPAHAPVVVPAAVATGGGVRFAAHAAPLGGCDLTVAGEGQPMGQPIGQRIVVRGRVVDENGRPVRRSLLEVWQANAAGRYRHVGDQRAAPLDPHFAGAGRLLTDDDGGFRIVTIRPGAYPWHNGGAGIAWRPAHIHFSLFGNVHAQRLVTQMYFPGDPLIDHDVIIQGIADATARRSLVARLDIDGTLASDQALAFAFDIVLRGRGATPFGL